MAGASCIPKFVKKEITDKWVGESLKLMLLKDTFTPNEGTQQFVSHVSSHEIASTTGYTAGGTAPGVDLTGNISVEHSPSAGKFNYYLKVDNKVIGTGATLNYRYGVVYYNKESNPATSPIRAIIDFLTNQVVTNGTSTIQWNALGLIYVS